MNHLFVYNNCNIHQRGLILMSVEVLLGSLKDDKVRSLGCGLVRRACSLIVYARIRGRLIVTMRGIGCSILLNLNHIVHKAYFS